MTNLDSILKSRDITLPTRVHLVKAMVFPVVMYGCESRDNSVCEATLPTLGHRELDSLHGVLMLCGKAPA